MASRAGRDVPVPTADMAAGHQRPVTDPTRRAMLRAGALTGISVPLLAACGSSSTAASSAGRSARAGGGGNGSAGTSTRRSAKLSAIATTNQVPKGGGLILPEDGVVVTQPDAGTFKGFSSICTHAGCTLNNVSNGTINCICHGSQFSISDGSVVTGPATAPLPKKPLIVHGKEITLASS